MAVDFSGGALEQPWRRKLREFSVWTRQDRVRALYHRKRTQYIIAFLITGNFLTNVLEKEVDPFNEKSPLAWASIEFVWNVCFLVECAWNMYGHFYITVARSHFLFSFWNLCGLSWNSWLPLGYL